MLIREANNNVTDFYGGKHLKESEEEGFGIGPFLYDDDKFFYIKTSADTPVNKWPRHVDVLEKYKDEIGFPVTENNKYEINRAFNRGFTMYDPDTKTYTIMAGTFFTDENAKEVLEAYNVPPDMEYVVLKNPALSAAEIDPKFFKG
jgi:hypothetical protein